MKAYYWLLALIVFLAVFYTPYYFGFLTAFWLKLTGVVFIIFGFLVSVALGDVTEGTPAGQLGAFLLIAGVIMLIAG